MPSKAPKTVEADPEDWLVQLMSRENLFKGIKADNVPYITLQNHARICYGSRGRPVTPLQQAEHDLHEKLKAKMPIIQLQKQLALVERLEEEQKNYEEARRIKKATGEDLLSDSGDDAPSSKRRKPASKVVADDADMAPPPAKGRHISRADDEPSQPQPFSQAQLKFAADAEAEAELARNLQEWNAVSDQEANDAEIFRLQAEDLSLLRDTSSDAVVARRAQLEESRAQLNQTAADGPYPRGLHGHRIKGYAQRLNVRRLKFPPNPPRPRVQHSHSDTVARQTKVTNRRKARPKAGVRRPTHLPDGEDEINYDIDDCDAGLPTRRSQIDLAWQIELDEENHGLDRPARAESVPGFVRLRARKVVKAARESATHNQRGSGQPLIVHGARAGRESNQSVADDSNDELPERPTARPLRRRPGSRLKKASAGSATFSGLRVGAASADEMLPPRLPGAVLTQANKDPYESNNVTMRRIQVGLRAGQNAENGDLPPPPVSRAPDGHPSQDYDEEYVQAATGPGATQYKWVCGKRYRLVRPLNKRGDGEEDKEVLCLSDEPLGCNSPPPRWQKFKLQGSKNGRVWSEDWDPQPDHQPKGAQYYMVPAGEAMNRPRLPDLELSRKHGMEKGEGSEYVGGPGSVAGSQADVGIGGGNVIGGSVIGSMAPPSTIGREFKIFSVKKGYSVTNHDPTQKHERSVMRTTPVSSMAGDRDAPQRTLAQRLGLDIVETSSVQDGPMNTASRSSAPRNSGQASRRQLTFTNVAILEAQTGQATHPAAVVRGKLRDVAPGDEGRKIWLGDERLRRPASIAPSESLRGALQTAGQARAATSGTSSGRNGSADRLSLIGPRDPRDVSDQGIHNTMRTSMGSSNGGSAHGGRQRDDRGGGNLRCGNRGGPGGRGGFGGRRGGSWATGSSFGGSQKGEQRGSGEIQHGGSQRGEGRAGGGRGRQHRQETQEEELERFRKEAEEKYPFQEA